jgi:hypothetical protein
MSFQFLHLRGVGQARLGKACYATHFLVFLALLGASVKMKKQWRVMSGEQGLQAEACKP